MSLKDKISDEINAMNNENISIISMKIYYLISEKLLEINLSENYNHSEDKIYNISSVCTDNIECLLKSKKISHLSNYDLTDLVYKLILTNIKYI